MKILRCFSLIIVILMSCGEEAGRYDVSKSLEFDFPFSETDSLDSIPTLELLKELDFGDLSAYDEYKESYTVNRLDFSYVPDNNNKAETGKVSGYYTANHEEVLLFEIEDFDYESAHEGPINLEPQALEQLADQLESLGKISVRIACEVDQLPASYVIYLYFDTTVAINLDL